MIIMLIIVISPAVMIILLIITITIINIVMIIMLIIIITTTNIVMIILLIITITTIIVMIIMLSSPSPPILPGFGGGNIVCSRSFLPRLHELLSLKNYDHAADHMMII